MKHSTVTSWIRRGKRWIVKVDGFSLIELMVSVVIVAIMVGLITPQLMKASTRAKETACSANTKTISAALAEYDLLHQTLPTGTSEQQLQTLVSEQLLSNEALTGNYVISDASPDNISVACASEQGGTQNGS